MRTRLLLPALTCLALALPVAAQQQDVNLPNLGSSAAGLISPQEETAYGESMLRELRSMNQVLDDPQVDAYMHSLGYRLVAASADPKQHYTFTVLRDPEINAFAAPGGYIFVNSGLIATTASESELAAVIAHELAHISQHHLERAFEDAKKKAPLYALATLGMLIAAGGSSQSAGPGIMAAGMGLMQQEQIDFTRKDEAEADRVGIGTLAKAGFNPDAMADFFNRMARTLRPGGGDGGEYSGDAPPFLQTHPVTSERIAEAKARAHVIEEQSRDTPQLASAAPADTFSLLPFVKNPAALLNAPRATDKGEYPLIRERVRVLSEQNFNDMVAYYARNLARGGDFVTPAHRYGYALALQRAGQPQKAVEILTQLLAANPGSSTLQLGLADADLAAGHRAEALQRYAALSTQSPHNAAIALGYAQALLADGKPGSAKLAQEQLKPLLDDNSEPELYRTYGHASHLAGDDIRAGEAYADATFLSGRPQDALGQLQRLSERKDLDYYARARIEATIALITPIALEMQRRNLPQAGDQPDTGSQLGFHACSSWSCPLQH
ncbi:MAG TPA: M48 family metalloprotease [Rhodanobacteraceae bacterium]|nr:M48 family metalloprotease [Rhodanobacteraceae bacterium]